MKNKKRIALIVCLIAACILFSGCAESNSAKLARLEKEAEEARQAAKEAQEDYDKLNSFLNKYGNK